MTHKEQGRAGGTFQVSRAVWKHPSFAPSKFSEREAFLWMISAACWENKVVRSGSVIVDLERGQLCFSLRFMAEKWGWSKTTVSRFLKTLEKWDMVHVESGTGQNLLSICNYDKYQLLPNTSRDSSGTVNGTKAGQQRDSSGTKKNTLNSLNTGNEVKTEAKASTKKTRKTQISENAVISEKQLSKAFEFSLSQQEAEAQFQRFKNNAIQNGRACVRWDAAWNNWLSSPHFKLIKSNGGSHEQRNNKENPHERHKRIASASFV